MPTPSRYLAPDSLSRLSRRHNNPNPPPPAAPTEKHRPMTETSGRKHRERIPEETKQAILAEPASLSNIEVARKYKVTDVTVGLYRRKAGIVSTARKKPYPVIPAAAPPSYQAPTAAAAKTPVTVRRVASGPAPKPEPTASNKLLLCRTISITVTDEMLAAWWGSLSFDLKTHIFSQTYMTPFTGASR